MQQSIPGIAFAVLVIAGGLVFGLARSEGAVQRRALVGAFCALALVAVCFFISVVALAQTWAAPLFALGSIAVPLAVYLLAAHASAAPLLEPASKRRSAARPAPRPAVRSVAASQTCTTLQPIAPLQPSEPAPSPARERELAFAAEASQEGGAARAASEAEAAVFEPDEPCAAPIEREAFAITTPETSMPAAPAIEPAPVAEPEPPVETASEPACATSPQPQPAPELAPEPQPGLELAPEPQPEPQPAPAEAAPARMPEPPIPTTPAPAAQPAAEAMAAKARALKEKGAHGVAARLFAEAAAAADDQATRRALRFEQLACCVKAGRADEARALVSELDGERATLTAAQRVKLDAASRML